MPNEPELILTIQDYKTIYDAIIDKLGNKKAYLFFQWLDMEMGDGRSIDGDDPMVCLLEKYLEECKNV